MTVLLVLIPLFAMLIAFISNMSGIGGGALLVLFFLYYAGLSSVSAGGLSLITIATSSLIGSYSNIRQGFINASLFKVLLVTGLVGVFIGSVLSFMVPTSLFKGVFGLIPLIIGSISLIFALKQRKPYKFDKPKNYFDRGISSVGLLAGVISGFTGMGIGGVTGTYLTSMRRMHPKTVFSTIILAMIITSVFGGLLHLGSISFPVYTVIYIPLLVIGAVVGALLGARLSSVVKSNYLRLFQAIVIIATGILAISIYFLEL
jgi:hypothetical protein